MDQFQSTQPIYLQIMERIKKEIVSEVLLPKQQLPTVRDLAIQYQVNPNTVQRALSELERLDLVKSDRTVGRFVSDDLELIQSLRKQMIMDKVETFVDEINQLKVTQEESMNYINQAFRERNNK
ncbi:MAG TPA: GntR family transcriptional regulator [Erysipelotrichaceae bacterium]|nr:GntR family transcriptional regulator [Erysipelotrichaceae bacterium]